MAHGIIDNPETAIKQNREFRTPKENLWGIGTFPFSDKNHSNGSSDAQFISPTTDKTADWTDPAIDYAFVILDKPLNPENPGVKVLKATNKELVAAFEVKQIKTYLYRAVTSFGLNSDGTPNFVGSKVDTRDVNIVYDKPHRVNQSCELYTVGQNSTGTDYPTEQGVSGSPFVSYFEGNLFLVGIAKSASSEYLDSLEFGRAAGTFVNSNAFCSDYQKVCGVECVQLEDVLK